MGEAQLAIAGLYLLLAGAATWTARRLDPREGPVAALVAYVAATDWLRMCVHLVWGIASDNDLPWLRVGCAWLIDWIFVSWFAANYAAAWRYQRGAWPRRLSHLLLALGLVTAVVMAIHKIQRGWFGLELGEVGVRAVVNYGLALLLVLAAVYETVRLFQLREIAPAHLLLAASIVVSLLQFLVALHPGEWRMDLYRGAVLVYLVGGLTFYAVRFVIASRGRGGAG